MTLDQLLDALDASPDLETSLEAVLTERKRKRKQDKADMAKLDLPGDASLPRDYNGDLVNERGAFGLHAPTGDDDLTLEGSAGRTVGGLMAPDHGEDGTREQLLSMLLENQISAATKRTAEQAHRATSGGLLPPIED